jgi:hypothetical protein
MHPLAAPELLTLWEHGARRHPLDRGALLAAAARPDWPADAIADLPLGRINASLLQLRSATFGPRIEGHADCPQCGQRLAFMLDTAQLLAATAPADADADADAEGEGEASTSASAAAGPGAAAMAQTQAAGLRLRAPSLRDLAAVADATDAAEAARALLARCTLAGDVARLDDAGLAVVEDALDMLDPQADLAITLHCVACGHDGAAQLDAGALLWEEIEVRAQELLHEVHGLASAYGWSEPQILALSPARRAAYLAMAGH